MALKRIGRYLLKTVEKGIILKPTSDLTIDCYVDADFAGLWNQEDHNDDNCVKSRTGYVYALAVVQFFGLLGFKMELHLAQWNRNM